MQPGQAARLEVLADAREEEVVDGLVHEVVVLALDDQPACRAVEDGDRPPEVVHDRALSVLVDDVAGGHERGDDVTERLEVGRPALDHDLYVRGAQPRRRSFEPGEVEANLVHDLGPVTSHIDAEPVDLEPRGHADTRLHLHIIAQAIARAVLTTAERADDVPANAPPPGGRAVRLKRTAELLAALVESDMRGRYGRGPWRLIKWLLDPFALVGVYLLLVSFVLDRPGQAVGLSLACAVIPFQLVMASCLNALDSNRSRRPIIANMSFPRYLIPASSALTESVAFAASLLLLALMMVIYAVAPTPAALWLPVVVAVNLALAVCVRVSDGSPCALGAGSARVRLQLHPHPLLPRSGPHRSRRHNTARRMTW